MSIVAVDLAAKYSAACWMDADGAVIDEWDSWGKTESEFIELCVSPWRLTEVTDDDIPVVMVVEDLPHGLKHSTLMKNVYRLQGRLYERMTAYGFADEVLFLSPQAWRAHYPMLKRGQPPSAVVDVCAEIGYEPPDLTTRSKIKGGKAIARKVATDYCAAFLIGRWAVHSKVTWDSYDVPGTSRYGEQTMRKPAPSGVQDHE